MIQNSVFFLLSSGFLFLGEFVDVSRQAALVAVRRAAGNKSLGRRFVERLNRGGQGGFSSLGGGGGADFLHRRFNTGDRRAIPQSVAGRLSQCFN